MSNSTSKEQIIQQIERAYKVAERASFASCLEYLKHVVINSTPPKPFRSVAESWQWALAQRLIPAIEWAAQARREYDGPKRFWLTLPKGHDKTTLIARLLNWGLGFSHTSLTAYAAAKDWDQAFLIADAMQVEANLNPWLAKHLQFKNKRVLGRNNSRLHILATDAGGNQGIRGDLVIIDELSQWEDQDFFDTLVSGISKRPRGILVVITNAGVKGSWQWLKLQEAKAQMFKDGFWYVYEAPGRLANYLSQEAIDRDRRMLPPVKARQLYENQWVSQADGCEFVYREQAEACEDPSLVRTEEGVPSQLYIAGVDYGPKKDRTALSLLHREEDGTLVVDRLDVYQGCDFPDKVVPVSLVENWLTDINKKFALELVVFDRYEMTGTMQKFQGAFPIEVFEPRGTTGNFAMAENLRSLIVNRRIKWPVNLGWVTNRKGDDLVKSTFTDELSGVAVKVLSNGYRIHNLAGTHDDMVVSVGMAALYASKRPLKRVLHDGDAWF